LQQANRHGGTEKSEVGSRRSDERGQVVQSAEYRTAEQGTAESRSDHFDISAWGGFDVLRFKEAVAQMKSVFIAFFLNSGF